MDRQRKPFFQRLILIAVLGRIVWLAAAEATVLSFICANTAPTYESESNPVLTIASTSLPYPLRTLRVQSLYEGSESGSVPWYDWKAALPSWLILHLALAVAIWVIISAVRPRWDRERIPYPMLRPLLDAVHHRSPAAWGGLACGLLVGAIVLPTAVIRFPAPLQFLNSAADLSPMLIALCLLMPRDACGSVVVWWLLLRIESWAGMRTFGISGGPMAEHQAYGAYVMVALFLLKGIGLRNIIRLSPVLLTVGTAISFLSGTGIVAFLWLGGVLLLILGYTTVRCNVGMPVEWAYPYDVGDRLAFWILGARRFGAKLSARLLSLHCFVRGGFPFALSAATEAQGHLRLRLLPVVATMAGLAIGIMFWLRGCYSLGLNRLGWWGGTGNMWAGIAINQQLDGIQMVTATSGTDWRALSAVSLGAGAVIAGHSLRRFWLFSPVHPMAFPLAATWGGMLWGPCLVAWTVRRLDKFGRNASRQLTDFAAGFVLGARLRRLITSLSSSLSA